MGLPAVGSAAAAGPPPSLSRRHAAGAPSARGLLFTLLGECVLTSDGMVWTSAVIAALSRLRTACRERRLLSGMRAVTSSQRPSHPCAGPMKE